LAFVSPATVLPRIVDQLWADINPSVVNALTETDIGIWLTPEGTTYVDGQSATPLPAMGHLSLIFYLQFWPRSKEMHKLRKARTTRSRSGRQSSENLWLAKRPQEIRL
jgi:hypothetical protein